MTYPTTQVRNILIYHFEFPIRVGQMEKPIKRRPDDDDDDYDDDDDDF